METNSTQQEILLITGTTFTTRQWTEKDDPENQERKSENEQLLEACWNGLLQEWLPEICDRPKGAKKLYLWQVRETASFLELDLGEFPTSKDHYFSIDPYSFMAEQYFN